MSAVCVWRGGCKCGCSGILEWIVCSSVHGSFKYIFFSLARNICSFAYAYSQSWSQSEPKATKECVVRLCIES